MKVLDVLISTIMFYKKMCYYLAWKCFESVILKRIIFYLQLGIRKLFSDADLTGLSSNIKNLVVSDVIQKAFINVTESGTEAAAATAG